jgi:hypothetical protein
MNNYELFKEKLKCLEEKHKEVTDKRNTSILIIGS